MQRTKYLHPSHPYLYQQCTTFPKNKISVTTEWVKRLKLYYATTAKMMMVEGKKFRHKQSGKYETTHLRTPYRLIVLLLNKMYGRDDGKFCKFGWIALIYHIAMKGTIFNWSDITAKNLSTSIKASQASLHLSKSEFYIPSFLMDCIFYCHQFEGIKCTYKGGKSPIYTSYHMLGYHKYHDHYNMICEEFLMPLYKMIFLEECPCLFE